MESNQDPKNREIMNVHEMERLLEITDDKEFIEHIGNYYLRGYECIQDVQKAINIYAKHGHSNPLLYIRLGNIYESNQYGVKNLQKSKEYYQHAFDNGVNSLNNIVDICLKQKDYFTALKYIDLATVRGYPSADIRLAEFYEYGYGIIIDYDQAIRLLTKQVGGVCDTASEQWTQSETTKYNIQWKIDNLRVKKGDISAEQSKQSRLNHVSEVMNAIERRLSHLDNICDHHTIQ